MKKNSNEFPDNLCCLLIANTLSSEGQKDNVIESMLKTKKGNKVEQSNIQWCGPTWNPWYGCRKVTDGCKFCYMYRDMEKYGRDAKTVTKSKTKFKSHIVYL